MPGRAREIPIVSVEAPVQVNLRVRIAATLADDEFVEHRGRSMTSGTFEPGFRVALHHKDLKICQAMLAADHVQLPMVEMTLVHYERLIQEGHGDEDISALYRLKRPLFNG